MMKKIVALLLCALMIGAALVGCGKEVVSSGTTEAVKKDTAAPATADEPLTYEAKSTDPLLDINSIPAADLDAADAEYQTKAPAAGEEVAVLHTNYGDISFKFFPEVAPKAVYSFIALAKAGRYDATIFHRVTTAQTAGCTVIQAGDYTNYNGTGGVSAYGEPFGLEVSDYLRNSPGSVAMARSNDPNSNGSQFYVNVEDNGALDGQYTVFAQVYDGMDVVNKIAAVERDASDKPVEDVVLKSVEIVKYS